MNKILVSVIIPCYNVASYIAECMESVLAQTYPHIEIIVIDNNSTDKTIDTIQNFRRTYPEKIFLFTEKKQGAPFARNLGLKHSKGEWLQFLDADDLLLPDKIQNQVNLVPENNKAVMVAGSGTLKKTNGKIIPFNLTTDDPFKAIANTWIGYTSSNLFKKEAVVQINGWDENLKGNQDMDLIFRLLKFYGKERFIYDVKALTIKRMRPIGQITTNDPVAFNVMSLNFQLGLIKYLKSEKRAYYLKNQTFYLDIIYYFIYRVGLFSPKTANELLKKELGSVYIPVARKDNRVSILHALGVRILGFRSYMEIRFLFKQINTILKKQIDLNP